MHDPDASTTPVRSAESKAESTPEPTPRPRAARTRFHVLVVLTACYSLLLILGTHLELRVKTPGPDLYYLGCIPTDKMYHFLGFGGLALLLGLTLEARQRLREIRSGVAGPRYGSATTVLDPSPQRRADIALVACLTSLALGVLIEFSQHALTRSRSFSVGDMVADALGCVAVFVCVVPWPSHWRAIGGGSPCRDRGIARWCCRVLSLLVLLGLVVVTTAETEWAWQLSVNRAAWGAVLVVTLAAAQMGGLSRGRLSMTLAVTIALALGPALEALREARGGRAHVNGAMAHQVGVWVGLTLIACLLVVAHHRHAAKRLVTLTLGLDSPSKPDHPHTSFADQNEQDQPDDAPPSFVGDAALVSGLTLVSRFTGLVRDAALAAFLGLTAVADAFFIGFLIPNLFRRLFGEGALTAAFLPRYTRLLEQDHQHARRFASMCCLGLAILLATLVLLGEVVLSVMLARADQAEVRMTLHFTRIMLPYMPLVCGVAFAGAMLQVHKRFGPPAAAPVLLNVILIVAALVGNAVHDDLKQVATFIAWSVLVAGVLQLGWQFWALSRCMQFTRHVLAGERGEMMRDVKDLVLAMIPMLIGLGVFQLNALADSLIAWGLSPGVDVLNLGAERAPMRTGDVAALQWSQRLYQFPLGVFGIAVATAIFPALSRTATQPQRFAATLRQGLRLTIFIGLPATVGLMLTALPLSRLIYERGTFETQDAQRVATILMGYAASIWAYSLTQIATRAFYAMDDAKTPLKVSLIMVSLNVCLNLALIWPLGAAGLAWSTAISAAVQSVLLIRLLRQRVTDPVDASVRRGWFHTAALTGLMAVVLMPALVFIDMRSLDTLNNAFLLGAMTLAGIAVVLVGARLAKLEELTWLTRR